MAAIELQDLGHSYAPDTEQQDVWALKPDMNIHWDDGGAYALLGPSGCGKTTMLNIISGLLRPHQGKLLFDGKDVTELAPEERNIAQVFQFPIAYDTMTVRENLAFPLINRGVAKNEIKARVDEVSKLLEIDDMLDKRAADLLADAKQKISLGRGLVRNDVNAILFDEPLTVIDPHIKWRLRANMKQLHQRMNFTMIYVTHDQTEALTFADRIAVMYEGRIAQVGTPLELFERPNHTFVGYFIGSPGMNIIPCETDGQKVVVDGTPVETAPFAPVDSGAKVGVRPEFISFADQGLPAQVVSVRDLGRRKIVDVRAAGGQLKVSLAEGTQIPSEPKLTFDPKRTYVYNSEGWMAEPGSAG